MPLKDANKKLQHITGISLQGSTLLLAGVGVPWDEYLNVPKGSRYFRSDGEEYVKLDGGDDTITGWLLILGGNGDPTVGVVAAANLTDDSIIRGDGGVKGLQDSAWTIDDDGKMFTSVSKAGYLIEAANTKGDGGGDGFKLCAGELLGDIVLSLHDSDGTFNILQIEADQGSCTFGKSYASTLADNGVVYGLDLQLTASNLKDINTQNGIYRIGGRPVVMGTEFQEVSSSSQSSTTSSSYQQKLRLTTPSLPSGQYRIGWYAEISQSSTGSSVRSRIHLNDSDQLAYAEIETKDSDNEYPFSGYSYETLSGVNTIDIDWSEINGNTASIANAKLEIWRIS